ncbi:MAG: DUF899 domain-containing protein [Pseudomonadota bacterium]
MTEPLGSETAEHPVVTEKAWMEALDNLRAEEKALTHSADRLAADRRRLPWMQVRKLYQFEKTAGRRANLTDLFEGRRQLIVYHHMLKMGDSAPCAGCSMVGDQIPHLSHLHARNTSLTFVSKAPISEIEDFKKRMGWTFPFASTLDEFNADFGVTTGFGLNVFVRDGADVYRTYFTTGRGVETLGTVWTLLDLTPWGRQENWEDATDDVPQSKPYQWWRLNDEY